MSNTSTQRRIAALEATQLSADPVTIIRIIAMPGLDEEPGYAEVGGQVLHRDDAETSEAFLKRVETEAKRAAKPGCIRVALVFPRA